MKNRLTYLFAMAFGTIVSCLNGFECTGQDFGLMNKYRTANVRVNVTDAETGDPLEFVAVYLCHQGDTVITNFSISNTDGHAVIEKVAQGKYDLNAELLGYNAFKKSVDIKLGDFEMEKNLGVIKMTVNAEFLSAASVSAAGNPVVIKKDTIIFNANAYKTGDNAMLADLLKKMPGIQIGSDGSIQVNGEKVDRLTVGGKTFFQKDPAIAVKTLPAKIVDQIQVIDKAKDDAAFTGVGTKEDQEKVMDLKLKDAYKKGWFGDIKLSGGVPLNGENKSESLPKVLFNNNAMVSRYNPTDQLVFLAAAKNASDPGNWDMDDGFEFEMMPGGSDFDDLAMKQGLKTTGQAGVNYNTARLKGLESTASASYNFQKKNVGEISSRRSFQGDLPDIVTDGSINGASTDHSASLSAELKNKDSGKYLFSFSPYFTYSSKHSHSNKVSQTRTGDGLDNSSKAEAFSHSDNVSLYTELKAGIRQMGKERRSLTLSEESFFENAVGKSNESSSTRYRSSVEEVDLNYDNRSLSSGHELELSYVEPFGSKWSLQARASGSYNDDWTSRDAFNGVDGSANANYTSFSKNRDYDLRQRLLMQYKSGATSLLFGFQTDEEQNVTSAEYLGNKSVTGKGEWIFNWAPYLDYVMKKEASSLRVMYRGHLITPSGSKIVPTLDLNNPVQVSVGNIYLRPQFNHTARINFRNSDTKHYSFLEMFADASLSINPTVNASWFDNNGIRYAIPVNSRKPGSRFSVYASYNRPFGKEKRFTFTFDGDVSYSSNTGYQTTSRLAPLDKDNFDYQAMMGSLWGNSAGDIFYSGKSGFQESHTNTLNYSFYPTLAYKLDCLSVTLMGFAVNSITKYSLDSTADMNTWDFNATGEIIYESENGWQLNTNVGYTFYKGYSEGFGEPELIWNAGIAKDIKAFTLSFKVADILGQEKSIHRTTSAEYVEDINRMVLGRYFLFGITFNFGKMNAAQSRNVERAMWNMSL